MNKYTIYCTEEQTRKALELGAPIDNITHYASYGKNYVSGNNIYDNGVCYFIPTAEQMLCWLEEQGIAIDLHTYFGADDSKIHHYQYTVTDLVRVFNGEYPTRKEATLAAIDAALEYLSNNKK